MEALETKSTITQETIKKYFLLWIAKNIASVLQLCDPRAWHDVLTLLILAVVGHIVKNEFSSDAPKGHNSGSPEDMLVDEIHTGGKRVALHNFKGKGTETVVADKLGKPARYRHPSTCLICCRKVG